jgi:3-oxoacyl-[acyl-carrier-protein] synthase-1
MAIELPALRVAAFTMTTALGEGNAPALAALQAGRSGLACKRFETVEFESHLGEVEGLEDAPLPPELAQFECRNNRLANLALAQDGFADAVRGAIARHGPERIGVFLGTSTSGILSSEIAYRHRDPQTGALPPGHDYRHTHNVYSVADFVRRRFGLQGPAHVVSTACSSSAKVFGCAQRMIACGAIDAAVVGGVDSLCLTTLHGFHSLQLVSPQACRPWDRDRDGISLGEGGAFALVERAAARGGAAAAAAGDLLVSGIGESSDAYQMSSPHPDGRGARLAMEGALRMAGLVPADIDYVNLHGTATPSNDAAEDSAVTDVFGTATPCSSTKGHTGHTLGAAGAIEAVITLLALGNGFAPGGANSRVPDPALGCRYLLANEARPMRHALSNSFGFGGSNCSLVLSRAR